MIQVPSIYGFCVQKYSNRISPTQSAEFAKKLCGGSGDGGCVCVRACQQVQRCNCTAHHLQMSKPSESSSASRIWKNVICVGSVKMNPWFPLVTHYCFISIIHIQPVTDTLRLQYFLLSSNPESLHDLMSKYTP